MKKKKHSNNRHETFLSVWEFSILLVDADVLGWSPAKISFDYSTQGSSEEGILISLLSYTFLAVETRCLVLQ